MWKPPILFLKKNIKTPNKQGLENFKGYLKHENPTEQFNKNRYCKLKKQKSKRRIITFSTAENIMNWFLATEEAFLLWMGKQVYIILVIRRRWWRRRAVFMYRILNLLHQRFSTLTNTIIRHFPPTIQQLINSVQLNSTQINYTYIYNNACAYCYIHMEMMKVRIMINGM